MGDLSDDGDGTGDRGNGDRGNGDRGFGTPPPAAA